MDVASLSASRIGPHTGAGVLVEVEASCALDFDRLSLDTVVEDIAYCGVRVSEESVTARALTVRLRGL